ncbi:hypothetical protein C2869_08395 [Saccharobesus litoralis]|uniref:SPOR domain-containing protein n=1 Tax=Saccharobesus litoralis TaxID=2172099 RepID=A0A2S0VQF0_9ALTE|nr:hypothetical protein [Saccharobesus litoralis]AWB66443.1 hypothetical protein C2869_08395 [Saccharobesus litoralis]
MKYFLSLVFSFLLFSPAVAKEQYFIQIGKCHLQKCVADRVAKALALNYKISVHRSTSTQLLYQVISAFALSEADADIYQSELKKDRQLAQHLSLEGDDLGYYLNLGYFESIALAYQIKDQAQTILKGEMISFRIRQREHKDEASKILIGPFANFQQALVESKKVRKTPDFPSAFVTQIE